MPEIGKCPPTNESMMVVPPTFREWKSTQQQQQFSIFGNHHVTPAVGVPHSNTAVLPIAKLDELIGVTFKASWGNEEEVSVMVEENGVIFID